MRLGRRRELEGTVDLRFDGWQKEPISGIFVIENRGGTPVDRAEVEVISGDPDDVGFTDDGIAVQRSRTFARLAPGVPQQATIRLVDQALVVEGKLKAWATFAIGKDEWSKLYELELPIYGPLMG